MKFLPVFIAVIVGIFWAVIAAFAFPPITVPVFLITGSTAFIALGISLVGAKSTGFDEEEI